MAAPFPSDAVVAEVVSFQAGPYRLQGELTYPEEGRPAGAVVLAGPHPLLGGNMDNNVVRGLAAGLAERGLAALRFDYCGVGGSEGPRVTLAGHLAAFWQHSRLPDEPERRRDLAGAVDFLSVACPGVPLALVGYSFGCSLLTHAAPPDIAVPLVLIAPTVGTHDLDALADLPHPKLVIAPEGDFAAGAAKQEAWLERLAGPKEVVRPRLDGHFFRGHEGWLVEAVSTFLGSQWRRSA
jgi:alpha/beta superfamily hydrolase